MRCGSAAGGRASLRVYLRRRRHSPGLLDPVCTIDSPPPLQATMSRTSSGAPFNKGVFVTPTLRKFPTPARPGFVVDPNSVCTVAVRSAISDSLGVGDGRVSAPPPVPVQPALRKAARTVAATTPFREILILDTAPREIIGRNIHGCVMRDERARRDAGGSPHRNLAPESAHGRIFATIPVNCSSVEAAVRTTKGVWRTVPADPGDRNIVAFNMPDVREKWRQTRHDSRVALE